MVRSLILAVLSLVLVACARTPPPSPDAAPAEHRVGSTPIPTSCDAGTFLGGTGQGTALTCQPAGFANIANPPGLPFFSPLTILEQIATTGDNIGGGGKFFGSNNAGANTGYTSGVKFFVTQSGHQASGVRFWWAGDATHELTTHVTCRLWDFDSNTSVASGAQVVGVQTEYSCAFSSAFTMIPGKVYVASIVDVGPCTPGGCVFSYTAYNSTNTTTTCGTYFFGNGVNSVFAASSWLFFGGPNWIDLQSGSTGDLQPTGTSTNCNALEPIVQ